MKRKRLNDDASSSGIMTLVFIFLLCGFLFVVMGFAIDRIVMTAIKTFDTFPVSQMRVDTLKVLITAFRFEPIIIIFGLGINHLINANRASSGFSDLSTLTISASEMIIITVVVMALTFFGGAAVEMVVNVMSSFTIASVDLDLFGAVQYTLPVFYGLCVIGILGAIVQFFVQCVSVVDYTQQY